MDMDEFEADVLLKVPSVNTPSRKRTTNFMAQEKLNLMELISNKYKNILENKKTDKVSVDDRIRAWHNIEKEFNASSPSGVFRDCEALKRLYENRKREIRRILSREKQLRLKTGGGPETKSELDTADQILLGIMNSKTVQGLVNAVDSDTTQLSFSNAVQENEFLLIHSNNDTIESLPNNSGNKAIETKKSQMEKFKNEVTGEAKANEEIKTDHSTGAMNPESDCPTWKKADDLKRKITPALRHDNKNGPKKVFHGTTTKTSLNAIRKSCQSIKILASSEIANKYNNLLDSRQILVEKQIEQINQELSFQRIKHKLEIELLNLEVAKKKKGNMSFINSII